MDQAADLYERMLTDTLANVDQRVDCTVFVAIDSPDSTSYFSTLAPGTPQVLQRGETLGERLDAVMTECLAQGYDHVYALGSDSPDLPAQNLDLAFALLLDDDVDVVLGPTEDGGYYLIGWKQRWRQVVTDVQMSTETVLADTVQIAEELGATIAFAPNWYDVDHPEDLDRLRASLEDRPNSQTGLYLASL